MNCHSVRRVVLAAERPEPPPLDVRPHLTGCLDCRAWLRRLAAMEQQLTRLPVPPTQGKERLLRRLSEMPLERASLPSQMVPLPARLKERGLRKLSAAFALAATVAAFAVGMWLWPTATTDPVAGWEAQRSMRVDKARSPSEKVRGLSEFAVKLLEEATDLARKAEGSRLGALAKYYDNLICHDLVEAVRTVPGTEREALLREVSSMLGRAESEMSRLAAELQGSAEPLRQIATTAREGDRRLREMLRS